MDKETLEKLGLTEDRVLARVVDEFAAQFDLQDMARAAVDRIVSAELKKKASSAVDDALSAEMQRLLNETVTPVDIFGEKVGEPTTIRAMLALRSKEYWEEPVNAAGKPQKGFGSKSRGRWMLEQMQVDAMKAALREEAEVVVQAFRERLSKDLRANTENILRDMFAKEARR